MLYYLSLKNITVLFHLVQLRNSVCYSALCSLVALVLADEYSCLALILY